jgi:hypothetical protein
MARGVLADAKRLLDPGADACLLTLCADYHANERWIVARSGGPGHDNEDGPEYMRWESAIDRRFTLFRTIATQPAHTVAGIAAKASVLPYQVEESCGQPTDDRIELFAINLSAQAGLIGDTPDGETARRLTEENRAYLR